MKAILSQNSSIQAQTIKDLPLIIMMKHLMTNILQARQASENNSLRRRILQQLNLFSQATTSLLANYKQNYGILHNGNNTFHFKYRLMTMSPGDLRHI